MICVRKRDNSWNARVRVSAWRIFTKSFTKKNDLIACSSKLSSVKKHFTNEIDNQLRRFHSYALKEKKDKLKHL